jgi:hypothetical protein
VSCKGLSFSGSSSSSTSTSTSSTSTSTSSATTSSSIVPSLPETGADATLHLLILAGGRLKSNSLVGYIGYICTYIYMYRLYSI